MIALLKVIKNSLCNLLMKKFTSGLLVYGSAAVIIKTRPQNSCVVFLNEACTCIFF